MPLMCSVSSAPAWRRRIVAAPGAATMMERMRSALRISALLRRAPWKEGIVDTDTLFRFKVHCAC